MEERLEIISETQDYLLINKKSGIIVNRSDTTNKEKTLQDIIDEKGLIDKNDPDEDFKKRSGIVHRLDKETSGLLIIAKNSKAFYSLQNQFKQRFVKKTYLALTHGKIVPDKGEIRSSIGRLAWNRKRFGVVAGGREAITSYEVISNFSFDPELRTEGQFPISNEILSYVRLFPKTGRTHQIRVHLKHIGHPIFSDEHYAGRKTARADRKDLPRIFLHAEKISFNDPRTGERLGFESKLPIELKNFLNGLEEIVTN